MLHVGVIDAHLGGSGEPWLLVVDVCSVHTSAAFMEILRTQWPHVCIVFVPPGTTSFNQPLDKSYFRSWKSSLRSQASRLCAKEILRNRDAVGRILSLPECRLNIRDLVSWATAEMDCKARAETGWSHIVRHGAELEELVAEALQLHEQGRLFCNDTAAADEDGDGGCVWNVLQDEDEGEVIETEAVEATEAVLALPAAEAVHEPAAPTVPGPPTLPKTTKEWETFDMTYFVALRACYGDRLPKELRRGPAQ